MAAAHHFVIIDDENFRNIAHIAHRSICLALNRCHATGVPGRHPSHQTCFLSVDCVDTTGIRRPQRDASSRPNSIDSEYRETEVRGFSLEDSRACGATRNVCIFCARHRLPDLPRAGCGTTRSNPQGPDIARSFAADVQKKAGAVWPLRRLYFSPWPLPVGIGDGQSKVVVRVLRALVSGQENI